MSTFSERLVFMLQKNKMSQRELAEQIQVTPATMSRYVSGDREPKSNVVANIATALNTTSDYLLGRENDEEFDFSTCYRILARNASEMTKQQKMELIEILFGDN